MGAVLNRAKVRPGATVVVFGCGGVGLNVVQAAALAGAGKIVAVDKLPYKLGLAEEFGATHMVDASREDPVQRVAELTGGFGADYAFEAIGAPRVIETMLDCLHRGGEAYIIGVSPHGSRISVDPSLHGGEGQAARADLPPPAARRGQPRLRAARPRRGRPLRARLLNVIARTGRTRSCTAGVRSPETNREGDRCVVRDPSR
jgi:hypothetical protein